MLHLALHLINFEDLSAYLNQRQLIFQVDSLSHISVSISFKALTHKLLFKHAVAVVIVVVAVGGRLAAVTVAVYAVGVAVVMTLLSRLQYIPLTA